MRKTPLFLAAFALPLLLAWSIGFDNQRSVLPTQAVTYQDGWTKIATLSACHGTLAVTGRAYATVDALPDPNVTVWTVPAGMRYATFRFQIDADANTADVETWAARAQYNPGDLREHFTLAWQFGLTGGTQTGPAANVFVDTVDVNQGTWESLSAPTDSGANRICRFRANLQGYRYFAWLRTDNDPCLTVVIDAACE